MRPFSKTPHELASFKTDRLRVAISLGTRDARSIRTTERLLKSRAIFARRAAGTRDRAFSRTQSFDRFQNPLLGNFQISGLGISISKLYVISGLFFPACPPRGCFLRPSVTIDSVLDSRSPHERVGPHNTLGLPGHVSTRVPKSNATLDGTIDAVRPPPSSLTPCLTLVNRPLSSRSRLT